VHRVVRRVEIQDHLLGRLPLRLQIERDKQLLDRRRVVNDLPITIARIDSRRRQLQSIQRLRTGQRTPLVPLAFAIPAIGVTLAQRQRQQRIVRQIIMIIEILIPQRQTIPPLPHQLQHRVLDQVPVPMIRETRRKPLGQIQPKVHLPQQQRTSVRTDMPPFKIRLYRAPTNPLKLQSRTVTLCLHKAVSFLWFNFLSLQTLYHRGQPLSSFSVSDAG